MSWIQKLYNTYNNCESMIGYSSDENKRPLLPICHITQIAHIQITIDSQGNFLRAKVIPKIPKGEARTIIPCTESSGIRTGKKPKCHPLCDSLQFIAGDFVEYGGEVTSGYSKDPEEPFRNYLSILQEWCNSTYAHSKARSVLKYVEKGSVIKDLVQNRVLHLEANGKLLHRWNEVGKAPDIFKVLPATSWQADSCVRWVVEFPDDPQTAVWTDKTLWESWINFYLNNHIKREDDLKEELNEDLCYVTGKTILVSQSHPKNIRRDGDGAKLISSNDKEGFTFRGRFTDKKGKQACGVGFEITQKAHSALRWLIDRQGYKGKDGQAIVAWATSGSEIPDPLADPLSILGEDGLKSDDPDNVSVAQNLAIKLRQKIAGYKADLGDTSGVVVMGLDSATPGRMAITFYRELTGSEFLERLEKWHDTCTWIHDYRFVEDKVNKKLKRKYLRFVGAPAPKDIAEASYGSKVDDKLKKATVERLLPCIVDGQKIPRDIVESAVRRASNRTGMERWEWEKTLGIACALFNKLNEKEGYSMALDYSRISRDYLYGRLLALADSLEQWALNKAGEDRQTNAARMMQRFADHPYTTWRTIELSLAPYKARLGAQSQKRQAMIDEVKNMFDTEDFMSDKKLSGEFLLAYSCQREALRPKGGGNTTESELKPLSETDQ